jgi:hypothetical protein
MASGALAPPARAPRHEMMFAMATAPLGQPHQSLRSTALEGDTEGTEGDSRHYRRLYFFAPLRLCVSFSPFRCVSA